MKIKRNYTFIYMPDDDAPSRAFKVPRWVLLSLLGCGGFFCLLLVMTGFGLKTGAYWWPGGGPVVRQNRVLEHSLTTLENKVGDLRQQVAVVRGLQDKLAMALDLPVLDDETFAAGIGGRDPRTGMVLSVNTEELPVQVVSAGVDLQQMLRQVQIQRQGYLAMIDTLQNRQALRNHIPSVGPTDLGWISSRFGFRKDPFTGRQTFHKGLDFVVPLDTPVHVTADGTVQAVQQQKGYGRVVKVDHGNGLVTVYAHLDRALVHKGDRIKRWDVIALSGNTGRSSAPHLHYEVHQNGRPVNPTAFVLDRRPPRS